jgi:hypothetical protein
VICENVEPIRGPRVEKKIEDDWCTECIQP